ncbi:MAG: sialidase family protein [Candidatus Dormibacteraceae bacterium]
MVTVEDSGLVYRNPRPELRAAHAWHPSLVHLGGARWLSSYDIGAGAESLDYATHLSWSEDGGRTWTGPRRLFQEHLPRPTTHSLRLSRTGDGTVLAFGGRFFRDDPERGLINTPGLGYTDMELVLLRSADEGRSWSRPEVLRPPLEGPCFETCHGVLELADGAWLAPTSTWMGWDGRAPNGMKAVALKSTDQGRSWPTWIDLFDDWARGTISWEVSVIQLPDRRLLAVAWALEAVSGQTEPSPYAIVAPDGAVHRGQTGISAQTAKLTLLPDGRVACVHRRHDVPGLWISLVRIEGERWRTESQDPLWGGADSGMPGADSVGAELSSLPFGYPSLVPRPEGDLLLLFWCREDCVNNIRWMRLAVD